MAISDLASRLAGAVKGNKHASIMSEKKNDEKPMFVTEVPMLNVAYSGDLYGGPLGGGVTQIVGEAGTFKTCLALLNAKAYMTEYPDAMLVIFDSEGGASRQYFRTYNIDETRVLHIPITDVEELKQQFLKVLASIDESNDHVIFIVDSLGLLASRKETEDTLDEKTTADMTRARSLTSFWRMVTVKLKLYGFRLYAINHFYETMSMYPTKVIKGGKAGEWASDEIFLLTKSKIRSSDNQTIGFKFNITVMKSRVIRTDSKIPLEVLYDGGIDTFSGLLDVARATRHVVSEKKGWYTRTGVEGDKNWRRSEMDAEWWEPILNDPSFNESVKAMYTLNALHNDNTARLEALLDEGKVDPDTGEILE